MPRCARNEKVMTELAMARRFIFHRHRKMEAWKAMKPRIFTTSFASVYPLYIKKAERKGRTKAEVDTVIYWLTGYDEQGLQLQIEKGVDFETLFSEAPQMNPNAAKITGVICGVRVEQIDDPLMQKIRWLDKLVDELAKGKPMEKILRTQITRRGN